MKSRVCVVSCVLVWLSVLGCQQSADPVPLSMDAAPNNASPAASASAQSDAFARAAQSLVGQWDGKIELAANLTPEQLPEEARQQLESMHITLIFRANGSLSMHSSVQLPGGPQTADSQAVWEVVRAAPGAVTIRSTEPDMEPEEIELQSMDGRSFITSLPEEQDDLGCIRFVRQ